MENNEPSYLGLYLLSPNSFNHFIVDAINALGGLKSFQETGVSTISNYNLDSIITDGLDKGVLKPKDKLLDLGSAFGLTSLIWTSYGFDVTGIEINKKCFDYSVEQIKKFKENHLMNGEIVKFINGSYFPPEYISKRNNGTALAPRIEEKYLNKKRTCEECFFPTPSDIYKENNLKLNEFDVFYAYLWDIQGPSVMKIFKDYSKEGALLVGSIAASQRDKKYVVNELGLKDITNTITLNKEVFFLIKKEDEKLYEHKVRNYEF
ncbi:MAG: hypothetical protein KJ583_03475 [Nanoarchaeota archaeon]|nr:hypothetical protein [Nanoarchaeota archaeon]MBU1269763.1 hypothetical protein [Nanoarchaeota archaeon]MBU1604355.1 hypothetical protein [Nanoarchaeota archaeon]MBU2443389.1 hypothetical protein [Nanoarchaeota archaeon]